MVISLISWLDAHSGAITALATVVLVLITGVYVLVTYLLVREQRLQGHIPEVVYEWANDDGSNADLRLHNVGNDTAAEFTIVLGPEEHIEVDMSLLGVRKSLRPGDELTWPIRPFEDEAFSEGDLPLTFTYFDNKRSRVFVQVTLIRFEPVEGRSGVFDAGSASKNWTRREVRALTRRTLRPWRWPAFYWRTRSMDLSVLLLEDDVREALRARLRRAMGELKSWSERAEAFRHRV
jgi:hypothetical protein